MRHPGLFAAAFSALLLLGACGGSDAELADIDNQIAGDDIDPALTSALEDQITVDPALTQQSNNLAVRATPGPATQQYPAPRAAQVRRSADSPPAAADRIAGFSEDGVSVCGAPFRYDARFASGLPETFPVYPAARVTDAAASDKGDCRMRVATFETGAAPRTVLDFYTERARRGGFSVEHQRRGADHVLAGVRPSDDGAYYLMVTPKGRGSEVALIANNGR